MIPMKNPKSWSRRGFSLVEVVLAICVFSLGILGIVGVLGPLLDDVKVPKEGLNTALAIQHLNAHVAEQGLSEWRAELSGEAAVAVRYLFLEERGNRYEVNVVRRGDLDRMMAAVLRGPVYEGQIWADPGVDLARFSLSAEPVTFRAGRIQLRRLNGVNPDFSRTKLANALQASPVVVSYPIVFRP